MADLRSERSWQKLADAQIELLLEQPGKAPTVEQVLRRAGVARATFYRHFTDLDSLLTSQVERLLDAIAADIDLSPHVPNGVFNENAVRVVLAHAMAKPELFRLFLTGQAGAIPLERLNSRFYQASLAYQRQRFAHLGLQSAVPLEIICSSISGQLVGMLRWLVFSPTAIDHEQVLSWMRKIYLYGFSQFLDPAAAPQVIPQP